MSSRRDGITLPYYIHGLAIMPVPGLPPRGYQPALSVQIKVFRMLFINRSVASYLKVSIFSRAVIRHENCILGLEFSY